MTAKNSLTSETRGNPESIIMVEWRGENQPTQRTRSAFLWHQIILSLLYDEVLALDETLIYGTKTADWFSTKEAFGLLRELFECGGLKVLKRPIETYPPDLQDEAQRPFQTRAKQLRATRVGYDGLDVPFDDKQSHFQTRLDGLELDFPDATRPGRLSRDLMPKFSRRFFEVLSSPDYRPWLRKTFPAIDFKQADEVARFAEDPELAIRRLHGAKRPYADRLRPTSGNLQFTPGLAVQIAAIYPEKVRRAFQSLTESVFGEPLCQDEGAAGRYSRRIPSVPDKAALGPRDPVFNVVVDVNIPLGLPDLRPGFGKIINDVRHKESVKELRKAMSLLGVDAVNGCTRAQMAWRGVAADLAAAMPLSSTEPFNLKVIAFELGRKIFSDIVVEGIGHAFGTEPPNLKSIALQSTRNLVEVSARPVVNGMQRANEREDLIKNVDRMVGFWTKK